MIYLALPDLVYIAERATGGKVVFRDVGLLESAAARPQATAFGEDAYPDLDTKAAPQRVVVTVKEVSLPKSRRSA